MPDFLSLEDVLFLHRNQVDLYGGAPGVRDLELLESAVAQPRATFGGEHLHGDLFEMAAAYLFQVVQNHPFVDGNKRTGVEIETPKGSLYGLTMSVARGDAGKSEIAEFFRQRAR